MENKKKVKIAVILFAILYLTIGLANLIDGAVADSRFYKFDDLLIRFIGLIFIVSSIGLFFKKEIGRKGVLLALSLSIAEIFIGVPQERITIEIITGGITMLILYVFGLVYFSASKNKKYFNWIHHSSVQT